MFSFPKFYFKNTCTDDYHIFQSCGKRLKKLLICLRLENELVMINSYTVMLTATLKSTQPLTIRNGSVTLKSCTEMQPIFRQLSVPAAVTMVAMKTN